MLAVPPKCAEQFGSELLTMLVAVAFEAFNANCGWTGLTNTGLRSVFKYICSWVRESIWEGEESVAHNAAMEIKHHELFSWDKWKIHDWVFHRTRTNWLRWWVCACEIKNKIRHIGPHSVSGMRENLRMFWTSRFRLRIFHNMAAVTVGSADNRRSLNWILNACGRRQSRLPELENETCRYSESVNNWLVDKRLLPSNATHNSILNMNEARSLMTTFLVLVGLLFFLWAVYATVLTR